MKQFQYVIIDVVFLYFFDMSGRDCYNPYIANHQFYWLETLQDPPIHIWG